MLDVGLLSPWSAFTRYYPTIVDYVIYAFNIDFKIDHGKSEFVIVKFVNEVQFILSLLS